MGGKETGEKATEWNAMGAKETGGKAVGAKATGAQDNQEIGGKGDMLMGEKAKGNMLTRQLTRQQDIM